jgi:hypothetical protein
MSDGLSRAAGSPLVWKVRGEDYVISPLTVKDFAFIEQTILAARPDPIETALKVYDRLAEKHPEQAQRILDKAYEDAKQTNKVTPGEIEDWLKTSDGITTGLWLSFKKTRKEMKREEVDKMLVDLTQDEVLKLMALQRQASGTDERGNLTGLGTNATTATESAAVSRGDESTATSPMSSDGDRK